MNSRYKTVVIIVNFNGKHLLEENLPSVLKQTHHSYQILIVDCNSTDGSQEFITIQADKYSNLTRLFLPENLGYAGGNTKGIEYALNEFDPDFVVILNNDVRVEENWLGKLLQGFKHDRSIGMCSSLLYLYYPYVQVQLAIETETTISALTSENTQYHTLIFENGYDSPGSLLTFPQSLTPGEYQLAVPIAPSSQDHVVVEVTKGAGQIIVNDDPYPLQPALRIPISGKPQHIVQNAGLEFDEKTFTFRDRFAFAYPTTISSGEVFGASGAAMAMRADVIREYGAFKSNYFMYFEDSELSFRYQKNGFKVYLSANAVGYHRFWGSSGGVETSLQLYYGTRNRLWFIYEYFGFWQFLNRYFRHVARTILLIPQMIIGDMKAQRAFVPYVRILASAWFILVANEV